MTRYVIHAHADIVIDAEDVEDAANKFEADEFNYNHIILSSNYEVELF